MRNAARRKGVVAGSVLVQAGNKVFGLNNDRHEVFCSTRKGNQVWKTTTSPGDCPKAILHAGDLVVVSAITGGEHSPRGELWIYSDYEGTRQATIPLSAKPAFDGMAVAEGIICVTGGDGKVLCLTE